MKFGQFPLDDAMGGILAHSVRLPDDTIIRKGTVLDDDLIDLMHAASMETVLVALPSTQDIEEDTAATLIAKELSCEHVRTEDARTGRVNFFSKESGVFRVSRAKVDALNSIDPAVTFATLDDYSVVNEGRLVATVKIIPYAVAGKTLQRVEELDLENTLSIAPFNALKVGLISTLLPGMKPSVLDKTCRNLERRLDLSRSVLRDEKRVFHQLDDITQAIAEMHAECDLLVLFGASAISDIRDLIPAAIEANGGNIIRFGMPVDPGNLLLLAELDGKPIIGAPGCARSIADNGFDDVLQRVLAGVDVSSSDIASMGVGGLRMETGSRPHPREKHRISTSKNVSAIILAAGQSRRMGDVNKMTVEVIGKPMLRHVAEAVDTSHCAASIIVTGHEPAVIDDLTRDLKVSLAHNLDYEEGLSSSLRAGISALPASADCAIVLLGDMPFVTTDMINQMIETARDNPSKIIMATSNGKRGNPVVWPRAYFDQLIAIEGDTGARHIIGANAHQVIEVELGEAAKLDLDTPQAVQSLEKMIFKD
ncbi:MAG: molybdopterin-binding/glycosyltransferase family 2 protein [Pseudomonadota bacterium]